ncbi:hypothetical protein F4804DRAFT_201608 [Jackrogersella minutella]|nr:hypothetical protein F4804DRAFT_201608 [Jackrogersella minutella]
MCISTLNRFSDIATFGFELEFLVYFRESNITPPLQFKDEKFGRSPQQISEEPYASVKSGNDDYELHMKRLHYFGREIASKLDEAGIVTVYREKGHPKDGETLNVDNLGPTLGSFDEFCYGSYKKSTVVPEETMIWSDPVNGKRMAVRPETEDGCFWLGFEFVSKAYRYPDLESMKSELKIICRTLRANYSVSINAGRDSIHGSSRCGVHVHWGLSGSEYNLLTVKRVITLMWVAEEMLMTLHATWRRDARKYAALLQQGTNMAIDNVSKLPSWIDHLGKGSWSHEMQQNVPTTVQGSLHQNKPKAQWIWRAETMDDLVMLVGEAVKSRKASLAITELLPAASNFTGKSRRSQLNTIEFRHMQGSLHPALIAAWIEVTAAIMRRCFDMSPREFTSVLEDVAACVADRNSTIGNLLDKLGVASETSSIFKTFNQQRLDQEADSKIAVFLPGMRGVSP